MRQLHFYLLGVLALAVTFTLSTVTLVKAQPEAKADPASQEQRIAALEHKIANLQKLLQVSLDDDKAVESLGQKMEPKPVEPGAAAALSFRSTLQTVRSQMELYKLQHNDQYPDLSSGWDLMLIATDSNGAKVDPLAPHAYGPYIQAPPMNPLSRSNKIVTVDKVGPDAGWAFDPKTGTLYGIVPQAIAEQLGLTSSDVATYK